MAASKEPAPAFQFYVKEWRSSRAIMRMSFAERGMYLEMLLEQWESFSLPDDPEAVADLIGGSVDEWRAAWPTVRRKFVEIGEGRIVNLKLETIRTDRRKYAAWAKKNARHGGLARAKSASRRKDGTYSPADEPAGEPAETPDESQPESPADASRQPASPTATATDLKNVHTPRARTSGGAGAGALPRDHLRHGWCGNYRKCVPDFLHAEFVKGLGGDEAAAQHTLKAFYERTMDGIPDDQPIAEDAPKFWRSRFAHAFGSPTLASPRITGSLRTAGNVAALQRFASRRRGL